MCGEETRKYFAELLIVCYQSERARVAGRCLSLRSCSATWKGDDRLMHLMRDCLRGNFATKNSSRKRRSRPPLDPELFNDSKSRRGLHKNCTRRDCRGSESTDRPGGGGGGFSPEKRREREREREGERERERERERGREGGRPLKFPLRPPRGRQDAIFHRDDVAVFFNLGRVNAAEWDDYVRHE